MGAINFTQTLHDSNTIPEALEQYERLNGKEAKEVFLDRGYKGIKQYKGATIPIPKPEKISPGLNAKSRAEELP